MIDFEVNLRSIFLIKSDSLFVSAFRQEQLACCFDNTIVNVFDSSRQLVEIYKDDNSHSDFVRGLAWHNDVLYSCAWDGDVNKHTVPSDFSTKILESKED